MRRDYRLFRWTAPSLLSVAVSALIAAACVGLAAADGVRPIDRMLMVSTRPVGCSTDAQRLTHGARGRERISNEPGCSKWIEISAPEALSSLDPATPTIIYIHGNRVPESDLYRRGMAVYKELTRCAEKHRPMQFVLFSWSSSKVRGFLKDHREKAARTQPVAWQLAWAINQIPEGAPIGLLGYSYGARISTGATHLLGGGTLGNLSITDASPSRPMRSVYLAPALDACWIRRGNYHGQSMERVESALLTCNPIDPAMKFFRFSSECYDPVALGYRGPTGLNADFSARIKTCNVSSAAGRSHTIYSYLEAKNVMRAAWRRLTYSDNQAVATDTGTTTR